MANLYDIDKRLVALIDSGFDIDSGECYQTQEELDKAIDECGLELDTKIENIGCFIKNLASDIEQLKKEEENLKARRQATEKKMESLKKYISGYLSAVYPNDSDRAKWKFKTPKVVLGYRRSTTVEVPSLENLDKKFIKTKTEVSADKVAIKDAIKNGQHVEGAYLQENLNLSIR